MALRFSDVETVQTYVKHGVQGLINNSPFVFESDMAEGDPGGVVFDFIHSWSGFVVRFVKAQPIQSRCFRFYVMAQ